MATDRKKIIIFGATGSIGAYLTDYLAEKFSEDEYEIIAAGRRKTDFFSQRGISYFSFDIMDAGSFSSLPSENVFAAVHLANILPARVSGDDPYNYFDVNVRGTINILEYLRRVKADRVIFAQTYADIAGHWGSEKVLRHDLPRSLRFTGDHALYAISKCTAQDIIEFYHETYGIGNFILRLPNIYMYSPEEYYYVDGIKRLISYRYIIKRAMAGEPVEIWGDPERKRDMIYIKDLCQLVQKILVSQRRSGVYNAGTGVGVSFREQIEGIVDVFSPEGKRSQIISCPEKPDAMEYIMEIDNARQELGYEPEYFYREYLEDYKKEMLQNRFAGLWGRD